MASSIVVAAAQLTSGSDPAENLAAVGTLVARAAEANASLVVFPEATMARFGSRLRDLAQPLDGPFASGVRAVAAEHGVLVAVGMFEPAGDGRVYNTLLVTGPGVERCYRKIHLYDAFGSRESDTVAPGSELVTVDAAGTTIGFATCYDVRFADQFTALGRAGARVVCLPASWGDGPGKAEQWDVLTRARALDAQAWLVAAGQAWVAPEGSIPLGIGRSVVVDPTGTVRARLGSEPGLLVTTLDLAFVDDVRKRVPLFVDQQPPADRELRWQQARG